jgi:uncharacterized protein YozE (UPF0346 family)
MSRDLPHQSIFAQLAERGLRFRSPYLWLAVVLTSILPISVGTVAFLALLKVVDFPDCRTSAWIAEASARLHCAEQIATKQTPDDLRVAIGLADSIAGDDPYRSTGERFINQWSRDLLRLAENAFQDGAIDDSAEMIDTIPQFSEVHAQAEQQLTTWKAIWRRAESVYQDAKEQIKEKRWSETLATARQLLFIGNRHWETTRYKELVEELELAREAEASSKAARAKKEAPKSSTDLFARWKQTQNQEMRAYLQKAYALAKPGNPDALHDAIAQAQMVLADTPQFGEAQGAIAHWKQQIETAEDRPYLVRAIALARKADENSLRAAIDEASLIPPGRALYNEARTKIEQWTLQVNQLQVPPEPVAKQPPRPDLPPPTAPSPMPLPAIAPTAPTPEPLPIDPNLQPL